MSKVTDFDYLCCICHVVYPDRPDSVVCRFSVEAMLKDLEDLHINRTAVVLHAVEFKGTEVILTFRCNALGLDLEG